MQEQQFDTPKPNRDGCPNCSSEASCFFIPIARQDREVRQPLRIKLSLGHWEQCCSPSGPVKRFCTFFMCVEHCCILFGFAFELCRGTDPPLASDDVCALSLLEALYVGYRSRKAMKESSQRRENYLCCCFLDASCEKMHSYSACSWWRELLHSRAFQQCAHLPRSIYLMIW